MFAEHDVAVTPGTRLASIVGDRTQVKSSHHQSFDGVGAGLHVTAHAEDGTPEALEDPTRRFTLGVLWHPEEGEDLALFEALVAEAAEHRTRAPLTRARQPMLPLQTSGHAGPAMSCASDQESARPRARRRPDLTRRSQVLSSNEGYKSGDNSSTARLVAIAPLRSIAMAKRPYRPRRLLPRRNARQLGQTIFGDAGAITRRYLAADRARWPHKYGWHVLDWCLLPNHIHLPGTAG